MPIRYVTVPDPILFKEPFTGEQLKNPQGEDEKLTFEGFLQKLMHNPMWGENYSNIKAQNEIMDAWEKCKEAKETLMMLGEEEWQKLKQATEFPKFEVITNMGNQTRPGYGIHPTLSRQLVPMVSAIMEAPATDPRVKAKA